MVTVNKQTSAMALFIALCWACLYFDLSSAAETQRIVINNVTYTETTYVIAVLSDQGADFNQTLAPTFNEYLNDALSDRFNGLVKFRTYLVTYNNVIDEGIQGNYDFAFTNPAMFTCLEAELAMSALVTLRRSILDHDLNQFGAVMFTTSDRSDITTVADISDKTVAAVSFITYGGFQAQWGKLREAGIDFLVNTRQIKFTGDEDLVVNQVLEGKSDVGFVSSGILEQKVNDEDLDLKRLRIISPRSVIMTDGQVYPFITSVENLSPEWTFAALPAVSWEIQAAVVDALIALPRDSKYALQGGYAAWQAPLSYTVTRSLQISLGVMYADAIGDYKCVRTNNLASAIVCPRGYVKKSDEEILDGCSLADIDCREDFNCLCNPCKPACGSNEELQGESTCRCVKGFVRMGGACVSLGVFIVIIVVPIVLGVGTIVYFAMRFQQNKVDLLWHIRPFELKFEDPVEVLGAGSYGVVLKAEYRGTAVAVKRVGPPQRMARGIHASRTTRDKQGVLAPEIMKGIRALADGGSTPKRSGGRSSKRSARSQTMTLKSRERRAMDYIAEIFDDAAEQSRGPQSMTTGQMSGRHTTGQESRSLAGRLLQRTTAKRQAAKIRETFIKEMRTLSKLRHPCVTTVMGAVMQPGWEPMMVMEHMDLGSLYAILHNETMELDGETRYYLTIDIVSGCRFLHSSDPPLIHGDLKSLNVLVDSKFRAKVSDFGLSSTGVGKACGTPYWMAPEVLRGEATTAASDVYSFSIILFEIFSRKDPYPAEADLETVLRDVVKRKKRPDIPSNCPENIAQLMKEAWHFDADRRPSFDELSRRFGHIDPSACRVEGYSLKKDTSNKVLEDVFPPHIANALREGKKIEPEHYDCVTIFFSDIVGFTDISSTLEPRLVMDMLDRLYTKFDKLAEAFELFKVETIGDAYMAVTNLLKQQPDHTERIALFAVEAIKAANSTLINPAEPELGCVNIRVGFHSGPVVANVVGTKNPRYCLFGDTVNTASRMESNSVKNRIHMSEAAADLLRKQAPQLELESRKPMQIKGKGKMHTFFLVASEIDHEQSTDTTKLLQAKKRGRGMSTSSAISAQSVLALCKPPPGSRLSVSSAQSTTTNAVANTDQTSGTLQEPHVNETSSVPNLETQSSLSSTQPLHNIKISAEDVPEVVDASHTSVAAQDHASSEENQSSKPGNSSQAASNVAEVLDLQGVGASETKPLDNVPCLVEQRKVTINDAVEIKYLASHRSSLDSNSSRRRSSTNDENGTPLTFSTIVEQSESTSDSDSDLSQDHNAGGMTRDFPSDRQNDKQLPLENKIRPTNAVVQNDSSKVHEQHL
eukprot:m.184170 g.184170  ORF g.184170 m.184170 type:complete len:1326 (+) comp16663_c4_seq1:290-4267(+)